jgi:ribosomal protein L37E
MPIPPAPTKTSCQSCGWSTVTQHRSDAIFLPSQCERCGSEQLTHTEAGALEGLGLVSAILDIFRK